MKTFTTLFLAAALTGCASIPATPDKPPCVQAPPPMLTNDVKIETYGSKQLGPDKVIVIQDIPSVLRFIDFLEKSEAWKRSTYDACKDPKAPKLEPTATRTAPTTPHDLTVPEGHRLDEDEE